MRSNLRHLAFVLIALIAACGGGHSRLDASAGLAEPADAGLTEEMFRADHVLDIKIEMAAEDWDEMHVQARSIFDELGASCLEEPPPRPFTYFPATVTVDGETITNVGVRKKGFFGSLSETKPSLKLKFSEYIPGQRLSGMKRLTLNNKSDPSHIKQCIGYQLFTNAGVPAPRCSFAAVSVNGNELGVFTNVESLKKQFVRRHFDDDSGNMYEGALSDFRTGWVDTFQRKTNKAEPGFVDDRTDIESLVADLEVADNELPDRISSTIDIDAFMTMWAMEVLLMHADGYARNANNFYIYSNPATGLWNFIPWGIDSILFPNAALPWEDQMPPESVWTEGALARRLYLLSETRTLYRESLQELLDSVWDEVALQSEVDRMQALLSPFLLADEGTDFDDAIASVCKFIDARRGELQAEFDIAAPTDIGSLRDPWCLVSLGALYADFSGSWSADLGSTS